jgi:hypothetical protein
MQHGARRANGMKDWQEQAIKTLPKEYFELQFSGVLAST